MAYVDGPMINKLLIKGVLHPITDNRIEGTNFSIVQIAGDVVVDTPLTADQLEHIKVGVLSEDGTVFNVPALGTILIPKDVVIQDPAPAEDYKVIYTSSPLEGKTYNLEVTIDHTTNEPKEAVITEGEVATPPVNITTADLEAIKETTPDPALHIIISDEAKALGQEAVDKQANIIVETDADGQPINVYHAVESPEPDKYYRYMDAQNHCIDIYYTESATTGEKTVDGLLFPDQDNIYVEKAKEYMEISTTQNTVVYKTVQPYMVEEHILGFEEVDEVTQTQGTNGIIHYPKSVLFTSNAAFTLALEGQDGYAKPADAIVEISTDGLNWEVTDTTAMEAAMNTELGKYALFVRCNDYLMSDTLTSWVHFAVSTGDNITVRGILNAMFGGKVVRDRVCNSLFKNMPQLLDASELLIPAETAKVNSYSSMFEGCTKLTAAPIFPALTIEASAYEKAFAGCISLTKTPVIAATTLATSCCANMFDGCIALTKAPTLSATTAANKCYYQMFQGCTSLVNAPALPATVLDGFCYQEMFKGCTALVGAPALPAMDIKGSSYASMFEGCTALVNAPALPATTFDATGQCYQAMFKGCTSLVKAPELPATTLALQCYLEMFKGCTGLTAPVFFPEIVTGGMKIRAMESMFEGCTGIKWATAGKEYMIAVGGGISGSANTANMFKDNSGDIPEGTGSPEVNKVYYFKTADTAIEVHGLLFSSPNEFKMSLNRMPPSGSVISYSTDGENYTDITNTGTVITAQPFKVANGEQYHIVFKSTGPVCSSTASSNQPLFVQNEGGSLTVSGKLEEFIPTGNATAACEGLFKNLTNLVSAKDLEMFTNAKKKCYKSMFYGCASLMSVPALPATTLVESCYEMMFYGCTSLTTAPALPAITLAKSCYSNMFYGCSALTTPPVLPAETMETSCYASMFSNCTSLASAPALPAMTLANYCYSNMFYGCSALTTPPALPATATPNSCYYSMFESSGITTPPELPSQTMQESCYQYMFRKCASLTSAPELPAMTLAETCYSGMFEECTSLTTPPALPATDLTLSCYSNMFNKSGLTTAPALPATTVSTGAYNAMFADCTALTVAPALLATTLQNRCYQNMFQGCTMLTAPAEFPTEFVSISESGGTGTSGVMYQMYFKCSNIKWSASGANTFKISIPSASFATDQTMAMFKQTGSYSSMFGSEGSPRINMSYTYV